MLSLMMGKLFSIMVMLMMVVCVCGGDRGGDVIGMLFFMLH